MSKKTLVVKVVFDIFTAMVFGIGCIADFIYHDDFYEDIFDVVYGIEWMGYDLALVIVYGSIIAIWMVMYTLVRKMVWTYFRNLVRKNKES